MLLWPESLLAACRRQVCVIKFFISLHCTEQILEIRALQLKTKVSIVITAPSPDVILFYTDIR
jgi:hypothetical protein